MENRIFVEHRVEKHGFVSTGSFVFDGEEGDQRRLIVRMSNEGTSTWGADVIRNGQSICEPICQSNEKLRVEVIVNGDLEIEGFISMLEKVVKSMRKEIELGKENQ